MPDDGGEIEARVMAWNPKLERIRAENGLPRHVKCSCDECAIWRSKNWQRIESLDWNPKEKPISPNIPAAKPQHNVVLTDAGTKVNAQIDSLYAAFGYKPKEELRKSSGGFVDPGTLTYADGTSIAEALAAGGYNEFKRKQKQNRRKPIPTPVPSGGKKVKC